MLNWLVARMDAFIGRKIIHCVVTRSRKSSLGKCTVCMYCKKFGKKVSWRLQLSQDFSTTICILLGKFTRQFKFQTMIWSWKKAQAKNEGK